ncbi:hypothetical protein GUI12_01675 [Anaplasmataceae bacterium AB001_6]|nr:hypothetical protein GUI12_01675 [Anaplasmataceae bacterium AB001_6]
MTRYKINKILSKDFFKDNIWDTKEEIEPLNTKYKVLYKAKHANNLKKIFNNKDGEKPKDSKEYEQRMMSYLLEKSVPVIFDGDIHVSLSTQDTEHSLDAINKNVNLAALFLQDSLGNSFFQIITDRERLNTKELSSVFCSLKQTLAMILPEGYSEERNIETWGLKSKSFSNEEREKLRIILKEKDLDLPSSEQFKTESFSQIFPSAIAISN